MFIVLSAQPQLRGHQRTSVLLSLLVCLFVHLFIQQTFMFLPYASTISDLVPDTVSSRSSLEGKQREQAVRAQVIGTVPCLKLREK